MLAVLGGLAEFERGLFNAWTDEGRKRAKVSGVEFGRKQKLTPHQEALAGPADGKALTGIGRTFGVIHSTILRLALSSTLRRPQSVLLSTHFPPVVDSNEVGGPYYGKRLWGMRTALVRMTSRCVRIAAIALLNELRRRMHQPIPEQGKWLKQVITGYFPYHAVPTNSAALVTFRDEIIARWRWSLHRRSQKSPLTWIRMKKLTDDWLPKPRILHPWPNQRFAVKHPR